MDRGAATEQLAGRLELVFQQNTGRRRRQECGGAARDQDQGQIAIAQLGGPPLDLASRGKAPLVRERVARTPGRKVARGRGLVVNDKQDIGGSHVASGAGGRGRRHAESRLPNREDRHTPGGPDRQSHPAERRRGRCERVCRGDARTKHLDGPIPECLAHGPRIRTGQAWNRGRA